MTPAQYRVALTAIGWTPWGLATRLGVHETRTRRWGTGRYPIPENVAAWLERLDNDVAMGRVELRRAPRRKVVARLSVRYAGGNRYKPNR